MTKLLHHCGSAMSQPRLRQSSSSPVTFAMARDRDRELTCKRVARKDGLI